MRSKGCIVPPSPAVSSAVWQPVCRMAAMISGQIALQVRHQRIIADQHHAAAGEEVEMLEEQGLVHQLRRADAMGEAPLAAGIDQHGRGAGGGGGMHQQPAAIDPFGFPVAGG